MLRRRYQGLATLAGLLVSIPAVLGHHGVQTKFDPDIQLTLEGRVTNVDWSNPHAHVFMKVGEGAELEQWYVEVESPLILEHNGWDRDTLQPGDTIRVQGPAARDGSPQLWGASIEHEGEQVLAVSDDSLLSDAGGESGPAPRWPDGQPRLGGADGQNGYWLPTATVLVEDGVEVDMGPYAHLADITDATRVAPLQDWALALYEFRQNNFLQFDPSFQECRPPAGPGRFLDAFGIQLLEDKPLQRIFAVAAGGNHDWQLIYTDGRGNDAFEVDRDNVLYYGRAVGAWEGDTLVIETEGFNEKFWLPGGLPHTAHMVTTERLTRTGGDTLEYALTIDDPGAYTRPWTATITLQWRAQEPPEYYCQDNRL